jgi:hypothetical protein
MEDWISPFSHPICSWICRELQEKLVLGVTQMFSSSSSCMAGHTHRVGVEQVKSYYCREKIVSKEE